jgi:hypothetical protein
MEVVALNSTNYIGLSTNYSPDSLLKFKQNIYFTEQGIDLPLSKALAQVNDSSTNNYSNLFLTQSVPLTSSAYIQDLEHINDDGFTTYLAANAEDGIVSTSNFLVVQEPGSSVATAAISMSGYYVNLDNRYLFTVKFYTDSLCKVEHINANIIRYLTIGSDLSLYFTFDTNTDYLEDQSPQFFNYLYSRSNNYLILSKNVQDVPHYIGYDSTTTSLTADAASAGIPSWPSTAIFTCIERPVEPNNTILFDPWVGYTPNLLTNTQDINIDSSTQNINSNILLHSQYLTLTGSSFDVNAISLKTTNTPENYQSRNNPFQSNKSSFLAGDDNEMREYKSLFTGSNQALGNDTITLGYESYTTDIVLKGDKVTHFHVPQSLYPFLQLNINDSGLIQAGAIAGDHPIKSDKVFKKSANASTTSPYGSTTGEINGTFLCSWLSGGTDITALPIWVDRYYNPSKSSFFTALTTRSLKAISYSTEFDGFVKESGPIPGTDDVFDVPSSLTFEPGAYYAYHHYGSNDVINYLKIFAPYIVETDFNNYYNVNGDVGVPEIETVPVYPFTGSEYAITDSLSGIQNSNQFTLCFDMYNKDWSVPFANQIIGNLLDDGFGVFNENVITPTIFVNSVTGLDVLNTDFTKIDTVTYPATALAFLRPSFVKKYSVVFSDGYLRQYTCDNRLSKQTYSPYLSSVVDVANTDTMAYMISLSSTSIALLSANLITNNVGLINTASINLSSYVAGVGQVSPLSSSRSVMYYNNNFYFTPSTTAKRISNVIYYITDNGKSLNSWDISGTLAYPITISQPTTAFRISPSSSATVQDFNIDFDGNIWILSNSNKYYKFTQNNVLLLSGALTSSTPITTTVTITGNGKTTAFPITAATILAPQDLTVTVNQQTLRPLFDYSLSGNNVVTLINPLLSGYFATIQYTQNLDTFANNNISFISEFYNGNYYNNVLFARVGRTYKTLSNTVTALSTSPAYQFLVYDTTGNQLSSTFYFTPSSNRLALTNTDYLREYVQGTYPPANLNIKAVTTNVYDNTDVSTNEIIFNLSALDPGYHHFTIRFDSYNGYMSLFVDAQLIQTLQFTPRKYHFSNLIYRPFLIGSSNFNNSKPLFEYLQKNLYLAESIKIKNFYLYDTPLNDYDIIMHARQSGSMHDLHFDIPCGRRGYLEEIERYFKADLPGSKSTQYNVVLRNTGITDPTLQSLIEQRVLKTLINSAPIYTKLNKIKWVN